MLAMLLVFFLPQFYNLIYYHLLVIFGRHIDSSRSISITPLCTGDKLLQTNLKNFATAVQTFLYGAVTENGRHIVESFKWLFVADYMLRIRLEIYLRRIPSMKVIDDRPLVSVNRFRRDITFVLCIHSDTSWICRSWLCSLVSLHLSLFITNLPFVRRQVELLYKRTLCDVSRQANVGRLLAKILWALASSRFWNERDFVRRSSNTSQMLVFECRMGC